jgi:hypothetical protein
MYADGQNFNEVGVCLSVLDRDQIFSYTKMHKYAPKTCKPSWCYCMLIKWRNETRQSGFINAIHSLIY